MCFSAQASFFTAAFLAMTSFFILIKTRIKNCLALSPLFFALQQASEGIVWLMLKKNSSYYSAYASPMVLYIAAWIFIFFAAVFWPLWIPLVLYSLETNRIHKTVLAFLRAIGLCVACISLATMPAIWGPFDTQIVYQGNHHLIYPFFLSPFHAWELPYRSFFHGFFLAAYCAAVILPCFVSTIGSMWLIGIVISAGFFIAYIFYALSFGSVWCFFGALSSVLLYNILRKKNHQQSANVNKKLS